MGRLPSSSLFKRRVKRALYNRMTERFKLGPQAKQNIKVEENLQEDEYSARDSFAKHGHYGIQTKDITTFSGGRAVASHQGKHLALKNDEVKVFSNHKDAIEHLKEDVQLDEISQETKTSYVFKAFQHGNELHAAMKTANPEEKEKLQQKLSKRNQGVIKAAKSLSEEPEMQEPTLESYSLNDIVEFMMSEEYKQLDELSKTTLGNYIKKASVEVKALSNMQGRVDAREPNISKRDTYNKEKATQRLLGIKTAVNKLTESQLEESVEKKIAALEKKMEAKQNQLEIARERRKIKGHRIQSMAEVKHSSDLHRLSNEYHQLKASLKESKSTEDVTALAEFSIDDIVEFMMSEEYKQLDELSKTTLGNYIKNASMNKAQHYLDAVHAKNPVELDKSLKQAGKRVKGISVAVKKLTEASEYTETQRAINKKYNNRLTATTKQHKEQLAKIDPKYVSIHHGYGDHVLYGQGRSEYTSSVHTQKDFGNPEVKAVQDSFKKHYIQIHSDWKDENAKHKANYAAKKLTESLPTVKLVAESVESLAYKMLSEHQLIVNKITESELVEGQVHHGDYSILQYGAGDKNLEGGVHHVHDAHPEKLNALGVPHDPKAKYGKTVRVSVKNNKTGELTQHHVYQSGHYDGRPTISVRTFGAKHSKHDEHTKVLHSYLTGGSEIHESLNEKHLTPNELKKREEIVKAMKATGETDKGKMYAIATAKAKQIAENMEISSAVVEDIMGLLVTEAKATKVETDCDHEDLYTHKSDESK